MEGRKWEELPKDCLVNIMEKVGLEPLLLDIPFVCKSWHKASLDPKCWKILDFSMLNNKSQSHYIVQNYIKRFQIPNFSNAKFMKLLARRSSGSAMFLVLPSDWNIDILEYFSDECPELTYLNASMMRLSQEHHNSFAELVGKFKHLQVLELNRFVEPIGGILEQIGTNCNNFTALFTLGMITVEEASAITSFIPRIPFLSLKGAVLHRDALLIIIRGCKELAVLDISYCVGVEIDGEILKEVGHIQHFRYEGCKKQVSDEEVGFLANWFEERKWKEEEEALSKDGYVMNGWDED
ncbi:hypothetical protein ACHQM5_003665 [Ranunculus cassubicifolius]